MTTHMTKDAIQAALIEINIILEIFFTAAFNCEYVDHTTQVKEMSTKVFYSSCNHPKAITEISRCKPELCPFGKEDN